VVKQVRRDALSWGSNRAFRLATGPSEGLQLTLCECYAQLTRGAKKGCIALAVVLPVTGHVFSKEPSCKGATPIYVEGSNCNFLLICSDVARTDVRIAIEHEKSLKAGNVVEAALAFRYLA
jgi:hypothetical protein